MASSLQAQTVTFGNFGPGVQPSTTGDGARVFASINSVQFSAVAFTVGSQPIQIQSIDLGLSLNFGEAGGFRVVVAEEDFPTSGGPVSGWVQSFSTTQSILGGFDHPERYVFLPDAAFTLTENTTYFLRLQFADPNGTVSWHNTQSGSPSVLSNYSSYALTYGNYSAFPNSDQGAYFITASVIPEASTSALLLGVGAIALGWVVRKRRNQRDLQHPQA